MKNFMCEKFGEAGTVIWYSLMCLLCLLIISGGVYAFEAAAWPWWLGVQRQAQGESKSFVDANNKAISMYSTDYGSLDVKIAETQASGDTADLVSTYKSQQKAVMGKICQTAGQMVVGTVDNYNQKFISEHGGCR